MCSQNVFINKEKPIVMAVKSVPVCVNVRCRVIVDCIRGLSSPDTFTAP